jgi:putative ABC transport system ATP-binding protein
MEQQTIKEDQAIIDAEGLTKVFALPAEEIVAVDKVDLKIGRGDFVSLMGPSGSGKTTLLDLLGCLDAISSGRLEVFGRDVSNVSEAALVEIRRGRIGFVFQEFLLLPELTAIENVELPMTFARMPRDRDRARKLLEKVGLGGRANHLPKELSGGERQRVAIARSLAASPNLLLADEPTGNLDTSNSREIWSVFERLNTEDGLTIVVATHDEKLGSRAGRVVRLVDGRITD